MFEFQKVSVRKSLLDLQVSARQTWLKGLKGSKIVCHWMPPRILPCVFAVLLRLIIPNWIELHKADAPYDIKKSLETFIEMELFNNDCDFHFVSRTHHCWKTVSRKLHEYQVNLDVKQVYYISNSFHSMQQNVEIFVILIVITKLENPFKTNSVKISDIFPTYQVCLHSSSLLRKTSFLPVQWNEVPLTSVGSDPK